MRLTEIDDSLHGRRPSFLRCIDRLDSVALFQILAFVVAENAVSRQKDGAKLILFIYLMMHYT